MAGSAGSVVRQFRLRSQLPHLLAVTWFLAYKMQVVSHAAQCSSWYETGLCPFRAELGTCVRRKQLISPRLASAGIARSWGATCCWASELPIHVSLSPPCAPSQTGSRKQLERKRGQCRSRKVSGRDTSELEPRAHHGVPRPPRPSPLHFSWSVTCRWDGEGSNADSSFALSIQVQWQRGRTRPVWLSPASSQLPPSLTPTSSTSSELRMGAR